MLTGNRVCALNNAAFSDISRLMNDLSSSAQTMALVATTDHIYLGSEIPFNSRFLKIDEANINTSALSAHIWTGAAWTAVVDLIDGTTASGKTFAQSGVVQWTKPRSTSWPKVTDSADVTGLSTTAIYDMYWARLTVSANLSDDTALDYIGHCFSSDGQLAGLYPELARTSVMTAFAAAKTTWEDQHIYAAEEIINDLRSRHMVFSPSQIFDWQKYTLAAIHKCAEIIYRSFGDDAAERRDNARKNYEDLLDKAGAGIDANMDGVLQEEEQRNRVGLFRA